MAIKIPGGENKGKNLRFTPLSFVVHCCWCKRSQKMRASLWSGKLSAVRWEQGLPALQEVDVSVKNPPSHRL